MSGYITSNGLDGNAEFAEEAEKRSGSSDCDPEDIGVAEQDQTAAVDARSAVFLPHAKTFAPFVTTSDPYTNNLDVHSTDEPSAVCSAESGTQHTREGYPTTIASLESDREVAGPGNEVPLLPVEDSRELHLTDNRVSSPAVPELHSTALESIHRILERHGQLVDGLRQDLADVQVCF